MLRIFAKMTLLATVSMGFLAGCGGYTTQSGLPRHIKTVEVQTFKNNTNYRSLEGKLTREIIRRVNLDPQVRVVRTGGDATLYGSIIDVTKTTSRETNTDRPASVILSVVAVFSLVDEIEGKAIVGNQRISSSQSSSVAGRFELDRGEVEADAENRALAELAKEIVRRSIGKW